MDTCVDSEQKPKECVTLWTDSQGAPIKSVTSRRKRSADDPVENPEIKVVVVVLVKLKIKDSVMLFKKS